MPGSTDVRRFMRRRECSTMNWNSARSWVPGNPMGQPIPIANAEDHLFGVCLLNDWSARDIQSWEYQPLGPFLAKNFATSISPWIVTLDALEPFRSPAPPRPSGDPQPLPHLQGSGDGAFRITLEVWLRSAKMPAPVRVSQSDFASLYWTLSQMIAHHTSNGCPLRPGRSDWQRHGLRSRKNRIRAACSN